MRRVGLAAVFAAGFSGSVLAQDYTGASSYGAQETLFRYDDQEPWKHGWKKQMNYHEGWHSFRPYNYHHVFGQTQAAAAWGQQMPYSQQWWHRYQSPSAQYNHLQGQPLTAMPQYAGPPAGTVIAPPANGLVMPPSNGILMPPNSGVIMPPAPMEMSPGYQQPLPPVESLNVPVMPTPLMPVN